MSWPTIRRRSMSGYCCTGSGMPDLSSKGNEDEIGMFRAGFLGCECMLLISRFGGEI